MTAVVGFCKRVLTKSRGWKRIVEKVPENDPAKKALRMGCWKKKIITISLKRL